MILSQLFNRIPICQVAENREPAPDNWDETQISGIHYRAQEVKPGGVFVAIPGFSADGHDFIPQAVDNGARVIVCQKPTSADALVVQVEDSRKTLAQLSANYFDHPSEQLFVIGVTGTNGKTTITYLLERILEKAGFKPGIIGTINCRYGGRTIPNPVTTPESLDLQRTLRDMQEAGTTHVVMEVSSHALDLDRVYGCRFSLGIFTNLTQDHLDFHKTMEAYWESKKRFFTEYLNIHDEEDRMRAVINCDDPRGNALYHELDYPRFSVGRNGAYHIRPKTCHQDLNGTTTVLETPEGDVEIRSPLVGRFNLENILCAAGAGVAANIPLERIAQGVAALPATPGRLEPVANQRSRFVYVDYAHTPDALENVLKTLRELATGRLITVFGCGGDRDNRKRPLMGEIAAKYSDLAVVTSDNPRTENPEKILEDILPGVRKEMTLAYPAEGLPDDIEKRGFTVITDRRDAIEWAVGVSAPGDTILIAGKGHETYQILGDRTIDFDDRLEAERALAALTPKAAGESTKATAESNG